MPIAIPGDSPRPRITLPVTKPGTTAPSLDVTFVLDSGAEVCVLEYSCVRTLHLQKFGSGSAHGVSGRVSVGITRMSLTFRGDTYEIPAIVKAPEIESQESLLGYNAIRALHLFTNAPEVTLGSFGSTQNCPVI